MLSKEDQSQNNLQVKSSTTDQGREALKGPSQKIENLTFNQLNFSNLLKNTHIYYLINLLCNYTVFIGIYLFIECICEFIVLIILIIYMYILFLRQY